MAFTNEELRWIADAKARGLSKEEARAGFDAFRASGKAREAPGMTAAPLASFQPPAEQNFTPAAPLPAAPAPPAAEPAPAEAPGALSSLGRGAVQGLSFGFGDEITGAIEAALTDKTYRQSRDEARARNAAAQAEHPWLYGGSEMVAGIAPAFIPGIGAAGAAAKAAGSAGKVGLSALRAGGRQAMKSAAKAGAALGAVGGAGYSEADLTRGDVLGSARDIALSSALGAASSAATTGVLHGARSRIMSRIPEDIREGSAGAKLLVSKKMTKASGGADYPELVDLVSREPELERALALKAQSKPKMAQATAEAVAVSRNEANAATYRGVKVPAGAIASSATDPAKRRGAIDRVIQKFEAKAETIPLARLVEQKKRDMVQAWLSRRIAEADRKKLTGIVRQNFLDSTPVPAEDVRSLITSLQNASFKGDPEVRAIAQSAQAGRTLTRAMAVPLEAAVERAKPGELPGLKQRNRDLSMLIPMIQQLEERAGKEASGATSLKTRALQAALGGGGLAAGLVSGGPAGGAGGLLAAGGAYLAGKAGQSALRHADFRIARLISAAKAGSTAARLGEMAIELGLGRQIGETIARAVARQAGAPSEQAE